MSEAVSITWRSLQDLWEDFVLLVALSVLWALSVALPVALSVALPVALLVFDRVGAIATIAAVTTRAIPTVSIPTVAVTASVLRGIIDHDAENCRAHVQ